MLREVNLTAVLTCLRQHAPISRVALAEKTGLNKATITRLTRDLIEHGFVIETGVQSSVTGRPSILLELNPHGGYMIGARLDVDYCSAILTNFSSEILWRSDIRHDWNDDRQHIQNNLLTLIQEAFQQVPRTGRPVLGLGVSMPGLVDDVQGVLLFAPNLGWRDVPIKEWLSQYFEVPIFVDNEANLAALGESYFGAAQDSDYVLYINITAGAGAGIVLNQQILRGAAGLAGEVGHITIDPNGPRCNCGNVGCWETFVKAPVLLQRIKDLRAAGFQSTLPDGVLDSFSRTAIPMIVESAMRGEQAALRALDETAHYLGIGIANLINIFNPQKIVLGGYLTPAYELMLPHIRNVVQARALRWSSESSQIVVAQYGSDASLMGAIATIYNHVLSFPVETLRRSAQSAVVKGGDPKGG